MPHAPAVASPPLAGDQASAPLPRTRFAAVPRAVALFVLAAVAIAIAAGLLSADSRSRATASVAAPPGKGDLFLYQTIDRRVAAGESYYAAATAEQRANNYPLRPAVTVRLPTLAWLLAGLGVPGARLLLLGLIAGAVVALARRLHREFGPSRYRLYGGVLAAMGLAPFLAPDCVYWHEAWSAVLVAAALALRSRDHWAASIALGLAAVLVRELALPVLAVMAGLAWIEGARREAAAWGAAIGVFALAMAEHVVALNPHLRPGDLHSQGWSTLGGWPFVLQVAHEFTVFVLLPWVVAAVVLPLALLGWAAWPGAFGRRVALVLGVYALAFMAIGRPDNDYWGFMMAPLLPLGLLMAPVALRELLDRAMPGVARARA